MKKTIKSLVALAAVASIGTALAQEVVVKIGHVAPMSGPQAHYGKDNENGARLAIEDLNKQALKIGGKTVKFELVAEDDAADPKQGTAVAQKLVDAKVNGVVGHLNSGTTIPASKIYNDAGLPQISPSASNPKYTQQGFKYAFRVLANDNYLGAAAADLAVKKNKAKTVAVIDDRTAYGQGVAEVFTKIAKKDGAKVVATQFTNDKATDFNAILTAIKAKKPDAVFYGGMDAQAGPLIRQAKQLGLNAKFYGGDGVCTDELAKLGGDAIDANVFCSVGGAAIDKMPGGKAFNDRYKAAYNQEIQVYAPFVYDAVMALAKAMQAAKSVDPKVYAPFVSKVDFVGVTGHIKFDKNGDLAIPVASVFNYPGNKKAPL